jgi:hypothetical protein
MAGRTCILPYVRFYFAFLISSLHVFINYVRGAKETKWPPPHCRVHENVTHLPRTTQKIKYKTWWYATSGFVSKAVRTVNESVYWTVAHWMVETHTKSPSYDFFTQLSRCVSRTSGAKLEGLVPVQDNQQMLKEFDLHGFVYLGNTYVQFKVKYTYFFVFFIVLYS